MNAVVRALKAQERPTEAPAAEALHQHRNRVARLNAAADATRQRIESLTQLLHADDAAREGVAAARAARREAAGRAVASGHPVKLPALDANIESAERAAEKAAQALAELDGRASTEAAVEHLTGEQRKQQAEARVLAEQEPRLLHGAASERLAMLAPVYAEAISTFLDTYVAVAAAARAADLLAPAARASQCASGVMMRLELNRPAHPAFESMPPVTQFGARVHDRTRELLEELGGGADIAR